MTCSTIAMVIGMTVWLAGGAFHLWCGIDFRRKKNRLDIAALEKRPLISDENSVTVRSGDVLLLKVPVYADVHEKNATAKHIDSLEKRGITVYAFFDHRSKCTQFFVFDQQALNAK